MQFFQQSLACGKARVLSKQPKGKDINDGDRFSFDSKQAQRYQKPKQNIMLSKTTFLWIDIFRQVHLQQGVHQCTVQDQDQSGISISCSEESSSWPFPLSRSSWRRPTTSRRPRRREFSKTGSIRSMQLLSGKIQSLERWNCWNWFQSSGSWRWERPWATTCSWPSSTTSWSSLSSRQVCTENISSETNCLLNFRFWKIIHSRPQEENRVPDWPWLCGEG